MLLYATTAKCQLREEVLGLTAKDAGSCSRNVRYYQQIVTARKSMYLQCISSRKLDLSILSAVHRALKLAKQVSLIKITIVIATRFARRFFL